MVGGGGGGGGENKTNHHHHHLISFQLRQLVMSHGKKEAVRIPPKGCMAVRVGQEGEQQERFVVPVMYLNHPLFLRLLEEAEEEYGFEQKGAITIPCHVDYFRQIQDIIDREINSGACSAHHHHHHHHHLLAGCFKA